MKGTQRITYNEIPKDSNLNPSFFPVTSISGNKLLIVELHVKICTVPIYPWMIVCRIERTQKVACDKIFFFFFLSFFTSFYFPPTSIFNKLLIVVLHVNFYPLLVWWAVVLPCTWQLFLFFGTGHSGQTDAAAGGGGEQCGSDLRGGLPAHSPNFHRVSAQCGQQAPGVVRLLLENIACKVLALKEMTHWDGYSVIMSLMETDRDCCCLIGKI